MGIRSFSFTLNGSVPLSSGNTRVRVYALSVHQNLGKDEVVTTYTESCPYTGEIHQSVSFGIGGRRVLPTPVQLAPVVPRELLATWQNILPKLAAFVQAMASVPVSEPW